jgi:hypothetical protein
VIRACTGAILLVGLQAAVSAALQHRRWRLLVFFGNRPRHHILARRLTCGWVPGNGHPLRRKAFPGTFSGQLEWQWQGNVVLQPQAQAGVLAGAAWQPQWQGATQGAQVQGAAWVWVFMGSPR